jgi:hypothetical protein
VITLDLDENHMTEQTQMEKKLRKTFSSFKNKLTFKGINILNDVLLGFRILV